MGQKKSVDSDDNLEQWENNAIALWEVEREISQKEVDNFVWEEIADESG